MIFIARIVGSVNAAGRISRYFHSKDAALAFMANRGYDLPGDWNGSPVTVIAGSTSLVVAVKGVTVR